MLCMTDYTRSVAKALWRTRSAGTRLHYATLPGCMASYGNKPGNELYGVHAFAFLRM